MESNFTYTNKLVFYNVIKLESYIVVNLNIITGKLNAYNATEINIFSPFLEMAK
jgi:hypothetical protein